MKLYGNKGEYSKLKIPKGLYLAEPEGSEVDCPDCGGSAIANDSGGYCLECSND